MISFKDLEPVQKVKVTDLQTGEYGLLRAKLSNTAREVMNFLSDLASFLLFLKACFMSDLI